MRPRITVLTIVAAAVTVCAAADRQWQIETCTAVGSAHDVFVSNNGRGEMTEVGRTTVKASTPVVGTYVLETSHLRLELREVVPLGPGSVQMLVGDKVSFAVQKNTAYVKDRNGSEHRLHVTKKTSK
jgi:hypothetical protein